MLAARVEPKNAPRESKKTDNFKPLVFREFQAGVDSRSSAPIALPGGSFVISFLSLPHHGAQRRCASQQIRAGEDRFGADSATEL
jgi:hypothetical protein